MVKNIRVESKELRITINIKSISSPLEMKVVKTLAILTIIVRDKLIKLKDPGDFDLNIEIISTIRETQYKPYESLNIEPINVRANNLSFSITLPATITPK